MLKGKTVIEVTLGKLLALPNLRGVVVCVAENDDIFKRLDIAKPAASSAAVLMRLPEDSLSMAVDNSLPERCN